MAVKERVIQGLDATGLSVLEPFVRLVALEDPKEQLGRIAVSIGMPIVAFGLFLLVWTFASGAIVTKYGTLPTPREVWHQANALVQAHRETRAQEAAFREERAGRVRELTAVEATLAVEAAAPGATEDTKRKLGAVRRKLEQTKEAKFSASPTYFDQIATSLKTVFTGFVVASLIAIPIGILCGVSSIFRAAVNPLIQIFKPVSPLAWLPIVMIVVGAIYKTDPREAWFQKSFLSSALTVAMCSLWPTLVNTGIGVASVDRDHLNVARVLNLPWGTRLRRVIVPSALPYIFAGLRISLGVGWMVLIAAEMLAQNPGLGKFVWDMFQNGSSQTLAQIMVAVFTIGTIGFVLDRIMVTLQTLVSYDAKTAA